MRAITAGDATVLDFPPSQPDWDFWPMWADGRWEADTHKVIAEHAAGKHYVDIGAWVGPTVLWAARAGAKTIRAFEPDPVALGVLRVNVALNNIDADIHGEAVTVDGRGVTLRADDFGESVSGGRGSIAVPVPGVSVAEACAGAEFVKVDIEGAEHTMLPELAVVGCPMLISIHAPWWPDGFTPDWSGWGEVRVLEHGGGFGEVLCLP